MEKDGRLNRRLVGLLAARLPEAQLGEVDDPRGARGKRWRLATMLRAVVVSLAAGCKSLSQAEALTAEMAPAARRRLQLERRCPDTTMRDTLVRVSPESVRQSLHAQVKAAHRRRALEPDGLPVRMAVMDGKGSTATSWDGEYAQQQEHSEGGGASGLVRTVTCALVSSAAKVCIDAIPIPAATNEMGHFATAFRSLVKAYGKANLFELVSYDAGVCTEANGRVVVEAGFHYLFGLKGPQPTLLNEAKSHLGTLSAEDAEAHTVEVLSNRKTLTRRLYRTKELAGFHGWAHLATVVRVESETTEDGVIVAHEDRYFVSSLPFDRLTAEQWLLAVRRHWGVENNCHHTWDTVFKEDERPWIVAHPRGMVVVMLLRRIAYNLLALFRSVTQRSEERRLVPWLTLLRWLYQAVVSATPDDVGALRGRGPVAALS